MKDIDVSIKNTKEEIKNSRVIGSYMLGGLTVISGVFVALGSIFTPWWLIGLISTVLPGVFLANAVTKSIEKDKAKLKKLIEQKQNADLEKEETKDIEIQEQKENIKTNNKSALVVGKVEENIETNGTDLTL